jgi:hypothetical protein
VRNTMVVILLLAGVALANTAVDPCLLTDKSQIIRTDIDKNGDIDILERWFNGKCIRVFDENNDMQASDVMGDIVGDCMQVDMNGDGFYDGPEDMTVKWADNDGDKKADMQIIVINAKKGEEKKFGGLSHYMVFIDTDKDGVMGYIDWEKFDLDSWHHTGRCNFSPDYNGNSVFLKAHLMPSAISDVRRNWENPFAFYDFDDDGCTEMSVRFVDNPSCDGIVDTAFISYDLDNDSQRDNEMDYDMTLKFDGGQKLDYTKYINKYPAMKAPDWVLPYFNDTKWRAIDELQYVPHDKCYEEAFKVQWGYCWFVFDEDDDDHRWERVELYSPNDPYSLRANNSYSGKKEGNDVPMNNHPQSDSLGDRGEWDKDFSGEGKLYIAKWDNRIHLYGAEWGAWTVDSNAQYNGAVATPNVCSKKLADKLECVIRYYDKNNNGFIDYVEYDYNGDKNVDLAVDLLQYGSDESELIDPAKDGWQGLHEKFKQSAKKNWQQAYGFYRVCWKKGLTGKIIDDLAFASSTWEMYYNGNLLKEKLFRLLDGKLAGTEKQKQLREYYFTGNYDKLNDLISK